jgi:hypothetical protein
MPLDTSSYTLPDGSTMGPGQKVVLGPWAAVNLATSVSATALTLAGVSGGGTEVAPGFPGTIIGITYVVATVITAGTLSAWVTKNGSTVLALGGTTAKVRVTTQEAGTDTFAATDRIGVKVTTSADYAPTSNDPIITVIAEI